MGEIRATMLYTTEGGIVAEVLYILHSGELFYVDQMKNKFQNLAHLGL